jgi:hypothetical protein
MLTPRNWERERGLAQLARSPDRSTTRGRSSDPTLGRYALGAQLFLISDLRWLSADDRGSREAKAD